MGKYYPYQKKEKRVYSQCIQIINKENFERYLALTAQKKPLQLLQGLFFIKAKTYQTLISTSTPEGNSNFIKASTVFADAL